MGARVHSYPAFQSELFLADGLNSFRLYFLDLVGVDRQYGYLLDRAVEDVVQVKEILVGVRSDFASSWWEVASTDPAAAAVDVRALSMV